MAKNSFCRAVPEAKVMMFDFTLNDEHERILAILRETGRIAWWWFWDVKKCFSDGHIDAKELVERLEAAYRSGEADGQYGPDPDEDWTPSIQDLGRELTLLQALGLVDIANGSGGENISDRKECYLKLTEEGVRVASRIEQGLRPVYRHKATRDTIFVACAFGKPDLEVLYETVLCPGGEALGYKVVRIDLTEPPRTITQAILESIDRAACVIADLTYARPSVYFEVGFAHGGLVPLVLTCRNDHFNGRDDNCRVHFDLVQFKISFWSVDADGIHWTEKMSPVERLTQLREEGKI